MPARKEALETRLWRSVDKEAPNGCWNWAGSVKSNGYGQISIGGRTNRQSLMTHRLVYEMLVGPIPERLDLDHLCRNRRCCNPEHLEPVSRRENLARGKTLVATALAKTHCVNGHEFTTANTHLTPRGHRSCRKCHADRERRRRDQMRGAA